MKITKTKLLKIINEVLSNQAEEDLILSNEAKNILMFLIMPALSTNKFNNVEDFLSRTSLIIGKNYGYLEFALEIDNQTAGFVNYHSITRKEAAKGNYCRPDPFQNKSTYMLTQIARSNKFKGYGIGRLLAFLSVCYINEINGSITSDRNTSNYAGKELVDSLDAIGAKKSEKFDYVGWMLGSIQRTFLDDDGKFSYPYQSRRTRPVINPNAHDHNTSEEDRTKRKKGRTKRTKEPQKQLSHKEELEILVKEFLKTHSPITPKKTDDCEPSVNITYQGVALDRIFYVEKAFKAFLKRANNVSSEVLQSMLDSDERVQGYTFTLDQDLVSIGKEICNILEANDQYDNEAGSDRLDKANSMFRNVYNKSVTDPGVGYKELDPDYITDEEEPS